MKEKNDVVQKSLLSWINGFTCPPAGNPHRKTSPSPNAMDPPPCVYDASRHLNYLGTSHFELLRTDRIDFFPNHPSADVPLADRCGEENSGHQSRYRQLVSGKLTRKGVAWRPEFIVKP